MCIVKLFSEDSETDDEPKIKNASNPHISKPWKRLSVAIVAQAILVQLLNPAYTMLKMLGR